MKNILIPKNIKAFKCICGKMFLWIFTKIMVLTNNDIVEIVECKDCNRRYCRRI
ncbi:unnamed protein product [marine sediment metagenome]|uniref:Uncharacterized protein n=1 Tax=marine sediment metagenome TaxID=412755 RepID=X0X6W7_9ZZZZ